ncbi:MAG TPA: biotin--[acetyl-CoA-carboxylase] ligase [Flavisolibacter sp.]|nr:biotin--[acetyl-CoA-carboxylase] ligase [Flavisolibacter sp.]
MSSPHPIGQPFIELLSVESTNNYAMGLARAGMAQHGTVVFTHEQTRGKGQRSKAWVSQKDMNIAMSILVEPKNLIVSELFLLSMMVAVGVRQLLFSYVEEDIKIKWPNDIYWRDRKAAGILIENVWQGSEWKFAVIGIGININQTDFGTLNSKAISLKEITGKHFELVLLAKELCKILDEKYQLLTSDPSQIIQQYKTHLYKLNEQVKLKKDSRVFEATFTDVTSNGQMVAYHAIEEKFDVGEVEWLINGG